MPREGSKTLEDLQNRFACLNKEEQIAELHKELAPHMLRRVKADVLKVCRTVTEAIFSLILVAVFRYLLKVNALCVWS